jgi:hypothetical protein
MEGAIVFRIVLAGGLVESLLVIFPILGLSPLTAL